MSGLRATRAGLVSVLVASALSAGAVSAVAMMNGTPTSLAPVPAGLPVPVTTVAYSDQRSVTLAVDVAADVPLSATGGGRITSLTCRPGEAWRSGDINLALDGLAVANLATAIPPWRDLAVGDRGDDVAALEQELTRLGADIRADGIVTRATVAAVDDLLGVANASSVISAASILWLPEPTIHLSRCPVFVGSTLAAGEPVGFARGTPDIELTDLPDDLVAGPRVVRIDLTDIPVLGEGGLDPTVAEAVVATSAYRAAVADGGERFDLEALLVLAEPTSVASVPPGSIYDLDRRIGCVLASGKPRAVTILGSQLGKTYVLFDGGMPATVEGTPGAGASACR
jgi:hypothetical protein